MIVVNKIYERPHFKAQVVSQPYPQTQNKVLETKPNDNNKTDKNLSPKAKAAIGAGLAALAGIGIYIATRGKTSPKTKNNSLADIIEVGDNNGKKYKFIKDAKTTRTKEYITYNKNGTEYSHSWYDIKVDTKNLEDAIIKKIYCDDNGNLRSRIIYSAPGKKSRFIQYNDSKDVQKYGFKIVSGFKYSNGKLKFNMVQCPGMDTGSARMYDIDGNVIRERLFYTPQGLAKAKAENNVINFGEI